MCVKLYRLKKTTHRTNPLCDLSFISQSDGPLKFVRAKKRDEEELLTRCDD